MCRDVPVKHSKPMPSVGYGFWKVPNELAAGLTVDAIQMGYRHLDCASDYGNEQDVGLGIESALKKKLCTREDLWVTSKLWNTNHRAEHVLPAIKKTLADLRLEYLDLYLIHFPISLKHVPFNVRYPAGWHFDPTASTPTMEYDPVPIIETWTAMEELARSGLAKTIGVSNFNIALIRDLLAQCSIRPGVLQVESHPYLTQAKLLRFCQQESIAFTAFSPLGAPSYVPIGMAKESDSVLEIPSIREIASHHRKTPAQVVLRWGIQRGTAVIPKSSRAARLQENLDIMNFELSEGEMTSIGSLDRGQRFNDPGVFCEQAFGSYFPIYE